MEVLSINQDPIVNIELSSSFNMKSSSFMVDAFEHVMDVVVQCSYSVEAFFCGCRAVFLVVIKVCGAWIKARGPSL